MTAEQRVGRGEDRAFSLARGDLWSAATIIVVADAAMSLDNVVALAAIARGNFWLLLAGVAFSIPVLAYGGLILSTLLTNAPALIAIGAALLGWIAGEMARFRSSHRQLGQRQRARPGRDRARARRGVRVLARPVERGRSRAARADAPPPGGRARAAKPAAAALLPQPPRAEALSFEPPEPRAPSEPEFAPSAREDRIAVIGVLILAVIAGLDAVGRFLSRQRELSRRDSPMPSPAASVRSRIAAHADRGETARRPRPRRRIPTEQGRRPLERAERLRQRAAWMYYVEEMTQSDIAQVMGVGRVSVARMLAQARALGEVRIALKRGVSEFAGLEIALAKAPRRARGDRRAAVLARRRPDRADRRRARSLRLRSRSPTK